MSQTLVELFNATMKAKAVAEKKSVELKRTQAKLATLQAKHDQAVADYATKCTALCNLFYETPSVRRICGLELPANPTPSKSSVKVFPGFFSLRSSTNSPTITTIPPEVAPPPEISPFPAIDFFIKRSKYAGVTPKGSFANPVDIDYTSTGTVGEYELNGDERVRHLSGEQQVDKLKPIFYDDIPSDISNGFSIKALIDWVIGQGYALPDLRCAQFIWDHTKWVIEKYPKLFHSIQKYEDYTSYNSIQTKLYFFGSAIRGVDGHRHYPYLTWHSFNLMATNHERPELVFRREFYSSAILLVLNLDQSSGYKLF